MIKVTYSLRGDLVGTAEINGDPAMSRSIAFFCEHCGEIWARAEVDGAPWTVRVCGCKGSLIMDAAPWEHNNDLFLNFEMLSIHKVPEKVLRREFDLAMEGIV